MRLQWRSCNEQGKLKVSTIQQQHISATQVVPGLACGRICLRHKQHSTTSSVATSNKSSNSFKHRDSIVCTAVQGTFEPHIDAAALSAQLLVLAVTTGAAAYWWFAVVPTARRTLAKEKRLGTLNSYLLELQSSKGEEHRLERWFYTDWLRQLQHRQLLAAQAAAKRQSLTTSDPTKHDADQATFDEEQIAASLRPPQQQKTNNFEQALDEPGDKQPSFWSLDNPLLATTALLAFAVAASLITHRQ
jgi:type II secretory pathway pseudopilin PulG